MKASELRTILDQVSSICIHDPDVRIGRLEQGEITEEEINEIEVALFTGKVVLLP